MKIAMEHPVSRAIIINLEHLPAFGMPDSKHNVVSQIQHYLKILITDKLPPAGGYLELPSFSIMAGFFKCSYLEIYDACRTLRAEGYDYQFSSLDGAVQVWRRSPADISSKRRY
jgi:hypothetical protein